jgi:hypothetical protein
MLAVTTNDEAFLLTDARLILASLGLLSHAARLPACYFKPSFLCGLDGVAWLCWLLVICSAVDALHCGDDGEEPWRCVLYILVGASAGRRQRGRTAGERRKSVRLLVSAPGFPKTRGAWNAWRQWNMLYLFLLCTVKSRFGSLLAMPVQSNT